MEKDFNLLNKRCLFTFMEQGGKIFEGSIVDFSNKTNYGAFKLRYNTQVDWHKLDQIKILEILPDLNTEPDISLNFLRSKGESLSELQVKNMLQKHNFFDYYRNPEGKGITHIYQIHKESLFQVVTDETTGLIWQQGGSPNFMEFEAAKKWIIDLNLKGYAGFSSWRLPTLEEAMSLIEREKNNDDLYIDPVFDKEQWWIWTADQDVGGSLRWVVSFNYGNGYVSYIDTSHCVRLVRSGQSSSGE